MSFFKDSFNGESCREIFVKYKSIIKTNKAKCAEKIKTKITDFRIDILSRAGKKVKIGVGAGLLGAAVISAAIFLNMEDDVYKLTISGKNAGYISDPGMITQSLEEIKADLSERTDGVEIIIDEEAIICEPVDISHKKVTFLKEKQISERILSSDICKANAWTININGANVVAASTEDKANSILNGVKDKYLSPDSEVISAGFKEDVIITQAAVNIADLLKPEDAVNLILTGTKEPRVYTVESGDTVWDIANVNGISPTELQEANPGFDPNKLKIGQQLNLYQTKPYVTVLTKEMAVATEKIDFNIVYESTSVLYKGEIKVKTAGVYGVREIKSEILKENGVLVSSTEVESVVTEEPKAQVALKGTKSISTFTGSGTLSSPMGRIEISSAYGSRGGSRHTGVDLRNPKGTPIKAADDGVVTFAGYSGSYGNIVKLSHGNGLETWYAHCNTMGVSVGQVVNKGDTIATVGITGRATGYHLHFEVRKNGAPQNPMNYL
ncbi:MAG: peptidoglycan DD-metalloendopeptidase family protein [Eubacteriales bacterium]|nr:peptidoglycan DD-metalloendopeptidase family protein [Eubacteriales bacterium]